MTSSQLILSPRYKQFRANEQAVGHLAGVFNDPVVQEALAAVQSLCEPTDLPEMTPGVHPDTTTTHHVHLLLGVKKAIETLRDLARVRSPQERLDDENLGEFDDYANAIQPLSMPEKKKTSTDKP